VADVGAAFVQDLDQPFAAPRDGNHAEAQAFADEEALALGDEERQREDAAQRRVGLGITQFDGLGARRMAEAYEQKRCDEETRNGAARRNRPHFLTSKS
jgi:hypothetical protein